MLDIYQVMAKKQCCAYLNASGETCHHEEKPSAQKAFSRDAQSLVAVIEELGNQALN